MPYPYPDTRLQPSSIMNREIFGPILPIVPVEDIDEAISIINSKYVLVRSS